jgi:hypothetical protein
VTRRVVDRVLVMSFKDGSASASGEVHISSLFSVIWGSELFTDTRKEVRASQLVLQLGVIMSRHTHLSQVI